MRSTFLSYNLVILTALLGTIAGIEAANPPGAESGAPGRGSKAPTSVHRVTLIVDSALDAPARHGIGKLEDALRAKGIAVSESTTEPGGADVVVVAGVAGSDGPAARTLAQLRAPVQQGAEALTVRKGASYKGKPAIVLAGSDSTGLMYAALDLADRVAWAPAGTNPFQFAKDATEKPYLKDRGVVIFTMNRAYFESHLHDEKFWIRYFDMFADDRINQLVLTFGYEDGGYMAPLYPYFFDVEGFPDVKVVGLTAEQQKQNFDSFRTMLRLATERGIRVKPGIWEHIYRGGGQRGAISWTSDGTKPFPAVVWGLNASNVAPYTIAALKKFYDLFPEITETQFRMHNESGLLNSEIDGFWHQVFGFFSASKYKSTKLELRAKGLPKSVIKDAQAQGLDIHIDTKIWMEQMGLPFHPTHINKEDQMNARQGYADLLEYPQTYTMNWALWNGGTQRILTWADPEYARRMAVSASLYHGSGLTVTEMEATKMLGEPPDVQPRDYLNPRYKYFDYEFERYWAFYRVWGRISYDPQASSDVWEQEYASRFGAAAPHLMKAQQLASRVLPRIVAASYPYRMFPTTTGWAEMEHMGSLPQFAQQEEGSDIQQFMNLKDEAASIIQGTDTAMRRPEETSRWFAKTSDAILAEVAAMERAPGGKPASNEIKATITDAKMLAALARYHSWRQLGGVNYNLYKQAGSLTAFDDAIADERKAIQSWHELVDAAGDFYDDDMAFGAIGRGFPRHWKDELKSLDTEFVQLLTERQNATQKPDAKPIRIPVRDSNPKLPVVVFPQAPSSTSAVSSSLAAPGQDFVVRARVTAPAGIKWIHLRYRHVSQKEDYKSVDMTLDPRTGQYTANIPASFIDPQWDLMYFVEIVDRQGNGRMYPDLETETPYIIVAVKR